MEQNLKKYLEKVLKKGKSAKLGFIERRNLRKEGESDAKRGIVRYHQNGETSKWTSPSIQRKIHSSAEAQVKFLGVVLNQIQELNKELRLLVGEVQRLEKEISRNITKILPMPSLEEQRSRMQGEEKLNEAIIQKRRLAKVKAENALIQARIEELEAKLTPNYSRLNELYSDVTELISVSKLICERMNLKTKQEIDCYWASVLAHMKDDDMPALFDYEKELRSVEIYRNIWDEINKNAKDIVSMMDR